MTEEEFISKECGFNIVKNVSIIYTVLGNDIYWFTYYDSRHNEVALSVDVTCNYIGHIMAVDFTERYTKNGISKEMYRERMNKLQKEIKELNIKIRKSEMEKDFAND